MTLERIFGPRVPSQDFERDPARFMVPSLLLAAAAVLLIVSLSTPYWRLELQAPQYPKGLRVQAYLDRMVGDVEEIDGLNHYIGMRPLAEAAQLERMTSLSAVATIALLVVGAIFLHNRRAAYLALPALLFPAIFLADLAFWLRDFGTNLDPRAPLASSVEPFVPPVLGLGRVGQFSTVASLGAGLYLALVASALVLVGLYFHRRAYKPLVERRGGRGARAAGEARS
jgi:hypothetical protein